MAPDQSPFQDQMHGSNCRALTLISSQEKSSQRPLNGIVLGPRLPLANTACCRYGHWLKTNVTCHVEQPFYTLSALGTSLWKMREERKEEGRRQGSRGGRGGSRGGRKEGRPALWRRVKRDLYQILDISASLLWQILIG